jgi:hypothetical protein
VTLTNSLFPIGAVVATPAALEVLCEAKQSPAVFLELHQRGEWGDIPSEDRAANTLALVTGERILSAYRTATGERLWVITEADRSSTCILLPDEY